jgi:hypothetical protein
MNNYFKKFRKYDIKFPRRFFCEKNDSRYNYEYESPQEQNINLKTIAQKFLKIVFKVSVFCYFFKWIFFSKFNDLTKQYNTYFINESIEFKLNNYFSKKIQKFLENYIYRTDTDEAQLVYKIYDKILKDNKIKFTNQISPENIYVIESPSIGAILLKNGDLFISNRVLQLANNNEDEIAFFISCEIAHLLSEKVSNRFTHILLDQFYQPQLPLKIQSNDFLTFKRESIESINKYLVFYPESHFNFFEEIDMCRIALKLLKNSGYDLQQVI